MGFETPSLKREGERSLAFGRAYERFSSALKLFEDDPVELRSEVSVLVSEAKTAISNSDTLHLISAQEGIRELAESAGDENLKLLINNLAESLGDIPPIASNFTAEEGVTAVHEVWGKGGGSYEKLGRGAAERVKIVAENLVRSSLERVRGIIPSREKDVVIGSASRLSGKLAFGVTVFGLGMLALGASAKNVLADVEITQDSAHNTLEIKNPETQTKIVVTPIEQLAQYTTDNHPNNTYEALQNADVKNDGGVNYNMEDEGRFKDAVLHEAKVAAKELFGKKLNNLNPAEFIKMINEIVGKHLNYDKLSLEDDDENHKISQMPLDEMYFKYGLGVCRHYAALVEKVGELIIESNPPSSCRGISIDEVTSYDQLHAWNIYYLNPKEAPETVLVGYTDITWDDEDGKFFNNLEARNAKHSSIMGSIKEMPIFSQADLQDIYRKLIDIKIGGIEESVAHIRLARENYDRLTGEVEDKKLLNEMIQHARAAGISRNDHVAEKARELLFWSENHLVDLHQKVGEFAEADKVAQAALIESSSIESGDRFYFLGKLVGIKIAAGHEDEAEKLCLRIFKNFKTKDIGMLVTAVQQLNNLYILEDKFGEARAIVTEMMAQSWGELERLPILSMAAQLDIAEGKMPEADKLIDEICLLEEKYKNLSEEAKDGISLPRDLIEGAIERTKKLR